MDAGYTTECSSNSTVRVVNAGEGPCPSQGDSSQPPRSAAKEKVDLSAS